jgi:arsenate reductase (thioredoxin)
MHLFLALAALAGSPELPDVGPLVRSLWLVQRHGTAEAWNSTNDQRVKAVLSKALAKDGAITLQELGGFMQPDAFKKLAGPDATLDPAETVRALEAATPESRTKLAPKLRAHADYLTTTFDMIDEKHREAGEKLAHWIAANYEPGEPRHVTVVCTGNSRRSILGSSMGNLAAAYYGIPEVRFHSGGTAPTAFNPRTVAALTAIGFEVEPTGKEAKRGEPKTENPVFRVSWGEGFETLEFSKHYGDATNPQKDFAALMVCSEADERCPFVKGATLRLSMPYLDPKIYDGGAYESAKYAERRDDIGRLMLSVMVQARGELASKESAGR